MPESRLHVIAASADHMRHVEKCRRRQNVENILSGQSQFGRVETIEKSFETGGFEGRETDDFR